MWNSAWSIISTAVLDVDQDFFLSFPSSIWADPVIADTVARRKVKRRKRCDFSIFKVPSARFPLSQTKPNLGQTIFGNLVPRNKNFYLSKKSFSPYFVLVLGLRLPEYFLTLESTLTDNLFLFRAKGPSTHIVNTQHILDEEKFFVEYPSAKNFFLFCK